MHDSILAKRRRISPDRLAGVWSATPTPFTDGMTVDAESVKRMVDHHIRLGVNGLFLAGTCGEGPWMPDGHRRRLVELAAKHAAGRLVLAVQVTDNSAARIVEKARWARDDGADVAVIAEPYFLLNATPRTLGDLYLQAIRESPLPVGIYDRGTAAAVPVPDAVLKLLYAEENVVLVKDSSNQATRREIALAARRRRSDLRLMNGYEFDCVTYLAAGYDGLLLGGGIFNAVLAARIMDAVKQGDRGAAEKLQRRMNRMMYAVYGGRKLGCWLSGLKKLLVEMGIFRTWNSYLGYPLTSGCERAIRRLLDRDADVLQPRRGSRS